MKVNTNMIHRRSTPVMTPKSFEDLFRYTMSINTDESIKALKKGGQRVSDKKPKRNEPCICGSGKKFKKCCINKESK